MLIRQQFRMEIKTKSEDGTILFLATRDFKDGSYKWRDITFLSFASNDIAIKGWAKKTDWKNKWYIVNPFLIEKSDLKIPINSDLDELCELMVTDFSAFERKLCEIADIQDIIKKDKLIIGSSYIFINDNIRIEAEYNNIKDNEATVYEKRLRFEDIPIANWDKMSGYLVWDNEKQEWKGEKIKLQRKIELLRGTIREFCFIEDSYKVEKFVQPIKSELVSIFEAVSNVDFDAIGNLLRNLSDFIPLEENDSIVLYIAKGDEFFVEIGETFWNFKIDHMKRKGKDHEVMETLKKLIEKVKEKGDDRRLRAYCRKIAKYRC